MRGAWPPALHCLPCICLLLFPHCCRYLPSLPCRLPFIVEPLACAAGLEAVIPCRLQEGPINRALCKESSKMQSPCDITAHPEVFARVVA